MKQVKNVKIDQPDDSTRFVVEITYEDDSSESFINPHYAYRTLVLGNCQDNEVVTAIKRWKESFTTCVHTRHCCEIHGCKYGDKKCLVARGLRYQEYPCESCCDSHSV